MRFKGKGKKPEGWAERKRTSWRCHRCLRLISGKDRSLIVFEINDFVYHGHNDGYYYRAVAIKPSEGIKEKVFNEKRQMISPVIYWDGKEKEYKELELKRTDDVR